MKRLRNLQWGLFALLLPAIGWASPWDSPYAAQVYAQPDTGDRIRQHLVSALLGAIVGAFFSQKFRRFRVLLILALILFAAAIASYSNVLIGDGASFIIAAVAAWLLLRVQGSSAKRTVPKTFGSAEWADLEHLIVNSLIGEKGFNLGTYRARGTNHPLHYAGDRHLLTVAPTRSGKGVSAIIPNLLTYAGSAIVIDPKGENARITAARRGVGDAAAKIEGLGQTVHVVDPWGITGLPSSCFNPLDWLNKDDEDINENAMMLADSIVPSSQGQQDKFWDEEAKALLMGLLLYVALDPREKDTRTISRVRDIICLDKDGFADVMLQMQENSNPIVTTTAARTISKEEKLRSNVLAALQAHTHFLDSPRLRKSLETSDFRFEDLKTSKMTIYLVIPADRLETFGRWLRLMVQQAITINARNLTVKPDRPILFLLDEMAALGHLTMVEQAYGLMAGFGMQLWGIVQDLSQLERIYGKGWETFIGNSGVLQYFGSRDHKTAEYFSKLCGVTTVEKFSISNSIARAFGRSSSYSQGGSSSGSNSGTTYSDSMTWDVVQRHLAFPDELMVLRDGKQLLIIENCNPISGQKTFWYKDDKLKSLGGGTFNKKAKKKASLPNSTPDRVIDPPKPASPRVPDAPIPKDGRILDLYGKKSS